MKPQQRKIWRACWFARQFSVREIGIVVGCHYDTVLDAIGELAEMGEVAKIGKQSTPRDGHEIVWALTNQDRFYRVFVLGVPESGQEPPQESVYARALMLMRELRQFTTGDLMEAFGISRLHAWDLARKHARAIGTTPCRGQRRDDKRKRMTLWEVKP